MSWRSAFDDILSRDVPLSGRTYYRIGGVARWFFEPRDAREAAALLHAFARDGTPWRVLGGGANLLIADGVHATPIVHLGRLDEVRWHEEGRVSAGAGAGFPRLVADSVRRGFSGLEALCGIPGEVGGACAMNAGGRHAEIASVVAALEIATPAGEVIVVPKSELRFAYRASERPEGVITRAELALGRGDPELLRRRMSAVLREKSAAQPLGVPSSGCVFKNPPGGSAGLLIEELGLKGLRVGGAEISRKHGNFILNRDGASAADVLALIATVESAARDRRRVALEREIAIWPST